MLYQKILDKQRTSQQSLHTKTTIFKKAWYTIAITCFLLVSMYGMYHIEYLQQDIPLPFYTNNITHADTIWTILNAQWYFEIITKDGKKIISDNIASQDIINLDEQSYLDITISESIHAQVVWPATFSVERLEPNEAGKSIYNIHMIKWDFVAIKSLTNQNIQDLIQVTTAEWVVVSQNDTPSELDNDTDFIVMQKNNNPVVVNKWKNALNVASKKQNSQTTLQDKHIATVDTQQDTVNVRSLSPWMELGIQDSEKSANTDNTKSILDEVASIIKEHEFTSQTTGTLWSWEVTWSWIDIWGSPFSWTNGSWIFSAWSTLGWLFGEEQNIINDWQNQPTWENITPVFSSTMDTWTLISNENNPNTWSKLTANDTTKTIPQTETTTIWNKRVLTEDQLYSLEQNIHGTFVMNDIQNIVKYSLLWKKQQYAISRTNLMSRVHRIYGILEYNNPNNGNDIASIIHSVDILHAILEKRYIVPYSTLHNLKAIKERLVVVQDLPVGSLPEETYENSSFEKLIQEATIQTTPTMIFK